ncbi:MAG: hypothetical protein JWM34_2857 [Ilumatobacteraceae bacterium]|nr:hypothetical protein [Ilumatobacteraceae bacterium]
MATTIDLRLRAEPSSVRTARTALQHLLGDGPDVVFVRDAILLTSEIVSNAVMHAPGLCGFRAAYRTSPDRLRVEVEDGSAALPQLLPQPDPAGLRVGGLGLRLIDGVATRWGTEPRTDGKVVWFELG